MITCKVVGIGSDEILLKIEPIQITNTLKHLQLLIVQVKKRSITDVVCVCNYKRSNWEKKNYRSNDIRNMD